MELFIFWCASFVAPVSPTLLGGTVSSTWLFLSYVDRDILHLPRYLPDTTVKSQARSHIPRERLRGNHYSLKTGTGRGDRNEMMNKGKDRHIRPVEQMVGLLMAGN